MAETTSFTRGSVQYRYRTGTVPVDTIFKADMDDVAQAQLNPSSRGASQAAHPRQAPRSVGKQEGLDMDDVLYCTRASVRGCTVREATITL